MKIIIAVITALLIDATSLRAQNLYDSARYQHLSDSAWQELVSYDYYGWAFEWDSIYFARWTYWSCGAIAKREARRRNEINAYYAKRNGEDDSAFPDGLKSKKRTIAEIFAEPED
ncbi:MAG: hypothetical protein WCH46_01745 [bacterium]